MDGETTELVAADWGHVTLNGQVYETNDPKQHGRELLTLAGLVPASNFQLILVAKSRTHLIGIDDPVDLKAEKRCGVSRLRG